MKSFCCMLSCSAETLIISWTHESEVYRDGIHLLSPLALFATADHYCYYHYFLLTQHDAQTHINSGELSAMGPAWGHRSGRPSWLPRGQPSSYLTCFHSSNEHSFYSSTREIIWWSPAIMRRISGRHFCTTSPPYRASRRRKNIGHLVLFS